MVYSYLLKKICKLMKVDMGSYSSLQSLTVNEYSDVGECWFAWRSVEIRSADLRIMEVYVLSYSNFSLYFPIIPAVVRKYLNNAFSDDPQLNLTAAAEEMYGVLLAMPLAALLT